MAADRYNAASSASAMQSRTRKERRFDEVEASLPDPQAPALQIPQLLNFGNVLGKLGDLNPWGKNVGTGDIVWILDNTAFKSPRDSHWQAEYITAVFEGEPKCKVVDIVKGIAKQVGLAEDAEEIATVRERVLPFLWDIRIARSLDARQQERQLRLGPTSINGVASNMLVVPSHDRGAVAKTRARVPDGVTGLLKSRTFYHGRKGWGIISDIDDTIKVTMTSDPIGILRETFVNEFRPTPGMPELYKNIEDLLPEDTPWFYLSASPYNLYPPLREFRDRFYPPGTMILKDSSWKTVSGLLSALTQNTEGYKCDRMKKLNSWFPERKMIAIGDSTQSDPEAYGEIYRTFPGWIKMIFIRKVTDVAAIGITEKNKPERFTKAFEGVPREDWHVFEDPAECVDIIKDLMELD